MSIKPTFQGEVQLRRWSNSSTQGVQITFALSDTEDLKPMVGKEGKRFMAVLVEIGDDEKPVTQAAEQWRSLGSLCKEAVTLCENEPFQAFARASGWGEAKPFLMHYCGIESRKDLDVATGAAERFGALRREFQAWLRKQREPA